MLGLLRMLRLSGLLRIFKHRHKLNSDTYREKILISFFLIFILAACTPPSREGGGTGGKGMPPAPEGQGNPFGGDSGGGSGSNSSGGDSSTGDDETKTTQEWIDYLEQEVEDGTVDPTRRPGEEEQVPPETMIHKYVDITLCLSGRTALVVSESGILYLVGYGTERIQEDPSGTLPFLEKIEGLSAEFGTECRGDYMGFVKITDESGASETIPWIHPALLPLNLKLYDKNFGPPMEVKVKGITPTPVPLYLDGGKLPLAVNNIFDLKHIIMPEDIWESPGTTAPQDFVIKLDFYYSKNPDYEEPEEPTGPRPVVDDPGSYIRIKSIVTYKGCFSGTNALVINEYGMSYMMSLSKTDLQIIPYAGTVIYDLGGNFDMDDPASCLNYASITIDESDIFNAGSELTPQTNRNQPHRWAYPNLLPYNLLPLSNPDKKPAITHVEECYDRDNNSGTILHLGAKGNNNFDHTNNVYILESIAQSPPENFSLTCDVDFYIPKN